MNKVRHWDKRSSQWFVRHFYILFFEIILVVVFFFFFANTINVLNVSSDVNSRSVLERLLVSQNINSLLILFLMLLNSFWMLFMFSGMLKIRNVLKDIDFNLSRRKTDRRLYDNE